MISTRPFPFQNGSVEQIWKWLHEYSDANFDDYGPKTLDEFSRSMVERSQRERIWQIKKDGTPCGVVAYVPVTDRLGWLHGVCFAKGFCTSFEKRQAMHRIFDELFQSGVQKICAGYFADNMKIEKFLSDLGAIREGYLVAHTMRRGKHIDMVQVAIFKV